jgi:hypothetical protein
MNIPHQAAQPVQLIQQMAMPSSLAPKSSLRSWISCAPRQIGLCKLDISFGGREARATPLEPRHSMLRYQGAIEMNSWVSIITLPWIAANCPPRVASPW